MLKRVGLFAAISLLGLSANAQAFEAPATGIRANVLWPFYPGSKYRLALRHSLHKNLEFRTEALIGGSLSAPKQRDTEGKFSEFAGLFGIRQYLIGPFNFEILASYGQSHLENHVTTGKDYYSRDLELVGVAGYEWMLHENWSVDIQAGLGRVVAKSNPWPIYKDDSLEDEVGEETFPLGAVHVTFWL